MTQVVKRSGELQEFDRTKLVASIQRAGADPQVANAIGAKITVAEGTSTMDLRRNVTEELRKVDERLADAYARTLRLRAMARDDVSAGSARVPKKIERVMGVTPGQPARVRHKDNRRDVRVEPALDMREVWLNRTEYEALGLPEGTRVAVRFLREGSGTQPQTVQAQKIPTGAPTAPKMA